MKASSLLCTVAVLACGCTTQQTTVPTRRPAAESALATEALAGGGQRSTWSGDGLRFSAEVSSTTAPVREGVTVRLELANTGTKVVHWNEFRMGFRAASVSSSENLGMGLPPKPWTYPGGAPPAPPFTLPSGESTSTVLHAEYMEAGVWSVAAAVEGSGGPSAAAPEIIVRLTE